MTIYPLHSFLKYQAARQNYALETFCFAIRCIVNNHLTQGDTFQNPNVQNVAVNKQMAFGLKDLHCCTIPEIVPLGFPRSVIGQTRIFIK